MKNLNLSLSRTVLIGLMVLLTSCVDKKKEENGEAKNHQEQEMHDGEMNHDGEMGHEGENHEMDEKPEMTVTESKTASSLIDNYLAIKNALVNDDKDAAAKAGESLGKSVASFDVKDIESSKQEKAKEILESMKTQAEQISKMDIAQQRSHFAEINTDIKNLLAITGSDRMLYQQYCPMYNNNEGGSWLSETKDVKNPLFGSKMLKCGSIKQTIALK